MIPKIATAISLIALTAGASVAAEEDARAARTMWTGFACSSLAALADKPEETERLFRLGYEAGQQFMAAMKAGTITPEEGSRFVPMGVTWVMQGPTPEFIIGRIYEAATTDAYDSVVKEDANGLSLQMSEWVLDSALQQLTASNRFGQANCDIIR